MNHTLFGDTSSCPTCARIISSKGRGGLVNHMNKCSPKLSKYFMGPMNWRRPIFALDLLKSSARDWAKTREHFAGLWGSTHRHSDFVRNMTLKIMREEKGGESIKYKEAIGNCFTLKAFNLEKLRTLEHYTKMEELTPLVKSYHWFYDDIFGEDDKTFTAPKQEIWINHPELPKIVEEYIPQQESNPIPQTINIHPQENRQPIHVDDDGGVCVPHEIYQILINGGASAESIKEAYAKHAPLNVIIR